MRRYALCLMLATACLTGCADQDAPISWPKQNMTAAERNFEANWIAAQQALRSYGFKIARMDRRAKLIITEPMLGQQAMEFWRRDAASAADAAESTVQSIYRTAQVEFRPVTRFPNEFEPVAVVRVARSDSSASPSRNGPVLAPPRRNQTPWTSCPTTIAWPTTSP
ncbi:MAG: hypothetical protein NT031_03640 [Planctomycetota bacterium]|nr:hypothetical protein [Planctomycetota bacterium]